MKPSRIALLTNITEEVTAASTSSEAVFAYELASALLQSARHTGGIAVDVIARKTASTDLPIVSVDPSAIGEIPAAPLNSFAWQDAVYSQLLLGGMLNGYMMVHCLAPIVTPLLLLAGNGIPVVQTITVQFSHPAVDLPPKLIGSKFRQVFVGSYQVTDQLVAIPPSVDLARFCAVDKAADDFIFFISDEKQLEIGHQLAASLGLPLYTSKDSDAAEMVKHAAVVVQLTDNDMPCDPVWLMRALACGTPVASWSSAMTAQLFCRPELGAFAQKGDVTALVNGIKNIPPRNVAGSIRREYALGMFGQRSQAARYRDIYKSVLLRR